ncbi:hypothetical protein EBU95_19485, partial [bacterium]|nr:hypothetical protein [bacterium]
MKFFNSMVKKAEIIEEARSARHAAIFDLSFITDQLKAKKLGVPYRDARRFWYDWARESQIWPEGIPSDSKTPVDAKSINALIGAYVTSDKFKPEVEQQWREYANDTKNIEQFFGLTRSTRAGKRGIELAKDEKDIKALSPEEITQSKEEAKKAKKVDMEKVDFAELKVKVLAKFDNPRLRQYIVDFALDNEVDSDQEAEEIADNAIEQVTNAFKDSNNISEALDKIEALQDSEDSATADLAEAAFDFIKKKITIEDEN